MAKNIYCCPYCKEYDSDDINVIVMIITPVATFHYLSEFDRNGKPVINWDNVKDEQWGNRTEETYSCIHCYSDLTEVEAQQIVTQNSD